MKTSEYKQVPVSQLRVGDTFQHPSGDWLAVKAGVGWCSHNTLIQIPTPAGNFYAPPTTTVQVIRRP